MSIFVYAQEDQKTYDYEFGIPDGLLEHCGYYQLVVKNQQEKDYMSSLALVLGLNRKVWTREEWFATDWTQRPIFKWFVDLGEFSL